MKKLFILPGLGLLLFGASVTLRSDTQAAICNQTVPLGAIAPAVPEWCQSLVAGIDTHVEGANSWVDDFNHGQTHATLNGSYLAFERQGSLTDSMHFQHNNHWMTDIQAAGGDFGGSVMRPNRSFRFEGGKLVIEAEVAAGIQDYCAEPSSCPDRAWVEIGVTNAPAPTGNTVDGLYAYGLYGGKDSFGCRLHAGQKAICALYSPNGNRTWEMSWFQHVAPTVYGGAPFGELAGVWRTCAGTDPDINCRDKFRLELTKTSVLLFVNGVRYFEQSGTTLFPDSLLNADVYVNFADWVYQPGNAVVRFHWDRIAINTLSGPAPTPTNTPLPTSTPTMTPPPAPATPTATVTPRTYRCQVRNANGSWTTVWSRPGGGACP